MFAIRKKNTDVIGLEFGSSYLKLTYVRQSAGKKVLSAAAVRESKGLTDADISKSLDDFIAANKIKSPVVYSIVPSQVVILKNIEVPSTNPKEIREIISLQAGRHTPYSREEVIVDRIDIGVFRKNYTKILMAIVPAKVIKKQIELVEKSGLKLQKVVFSPEAVVWMLSRAAKIDSQSGPVCVVHVDNDFSDFIVVSKGKLVYVRSLPLGRVHLSAAQDKASWKKFSEEIKKSLEAYIAEDIEKVPVRLYYTGAVAGLDKLESVLADSIHVQQIKKIQYAKNFDIGPQAEEYLADGCPYSLMGSAAALSGAGDLKIDLTPEEMKIKKALAKRGQDLMIMSMLVLMIAIVFCSMLIGSIFFKSAYLKKLDLQYKQLYAQTKSLESSYDKITAVRAYLANRCYPLDVLVDMSGALYDEMELNDIRYDRQSGRVGIKGVALTRSNVFDFVDMLSKSRYFKEVKTRQTTARKEAGKDVIDFELSGTLR